MTIGIGLFYLVEPQVDCGAFERMKAVTLKRIQRNPSLSAVQLLEWAEHLDAEVCENYQYLHPISRLMFEEFRGIRKQYPVAELDNCRTISWNLNLPTESVVEEYSAFDFRIC